MYDKALVADSLQNIEESLLEILDWTEKIRSVDDFVSSPDGMMMLNAVCMKLIAVGEEIKNIDKRSDKTLLCRYPEIDWRKAMKMRDVIVHHYFEIDAAVVFQTLRVDIIPLLAAISLIRKDLT